MIPRVLVYRAASDRAPRVAWNRYGATTIGVAVRLPRLRILSVQWRRP